MHGHRAGILHLLNTEVDSMGGVFDFGVGSDTKTSLRRAAIAKAQEELSLEYVVREERKRELEFLEKGGNPLDFKFGRAASLSMQSTSFTDQFTEQYVISEAKGSFALAASPHGDSAESSGRPAGSVDREANIADNAVLFDGETSNLIVEKNTKRTGRKSNGTPLEQSSRIDGRRNMKDSDDSVIFHLGAKGQAYARRNRSRSNRDSYSNKSLTLPSSCADFRDNKESHAGADAEVHAVSSISNSKSAAPDIRTVPKGSAAENQVDMEVDEEKMKTLCTDKSKSGMQGAETSTSEELHAAEHNATPVEQATYNNATLPSQLTRKEDILSALSPPVGNITAVGPDEENCYTASDADMINLHDNDMDVKKYASYIEVGAQNIDTEPSHIRTGCLNEMADGDDSLASRTDDTFDGNSKKQAVCEWTLNDNSAREKGQLVGSAAYASSNDKEICLKTSIRISVVQAKDEMEPFVRGGDKGDDRPLSNVESVKDRKLENSWGNSSHTIIKSGGVTSMTVGPTQEPIATILKIVPTTASELMSSEASRLKFAKKAHEDAILREARIIETNLKRAGAPSKSCISSENLQKCHWDFVLEEMAWMANDFMQERLWKTTAAAQVCQWISSVGRPNFEQKNICQKQRKVARTLAKAIMQFWHSAEAIRSIGGASTAVNKCCNAESVKLSNSSSLDIANSQQGIQSYAVRFLRHFSNSSDDPVLTNAPSTPDTIKDVNMLEKSRDDQLPDECLFYKVPPGAMYSYRESMESQWAHYKKMSNAMYREDCETSMCGSVADGSRESIFGEDEGETGTDFLSGAFGGNLSFKITNKKRKKFQQKSYSQREYGVGADFSYERYPDGKCANQFLPIMGKRPSSNLNVGVVPTKRTRTAARQRIVSSFTAGALQATSRTDVSSGDTSSLQDDQSSQHGGSQHRKNLEVEYKVDYERHLPFDGNDLSTKSKKKRKPKHLGYKSSLKLPDSAVLIVPGKASSYEQTLQTDSLQQDQRDLMKKRFVSQPLESNGNTGFYGHHVPKKPKFLKHTESHEQLSLPGGPMPSPVASQMSNMSNPNKLIRIINNRDGGRKTKAMKVAAGQAGSGTPWSIFEDQALVVLVHDMGLNWELVSDALNSTLHFKCIYRKPKDCKERHKFLMDRSGGDGADSAEDSGSSQPYPSTLPGIPKGSARQLFQRLQGPMEEDTLKSHFEKIILFGQRLHSQRTQNDNQDIKQITPAHSSHVFALSQACPNNLSGSIPSPLDLCDAVSSVPDATGLGYQGSPANGITIAGHQGSLAPVLPTSNANTMLHGSPSMVLVNGLPSTSPSVNTPSSYLCRDAQRYPVPRSTTLLVDDQHRLQNYTQTLSGRNMQQSGISVPGSSPAGVDRGARAMHANGMGVMCGVNRSMSTPRPGLQGINPSGMLNMVSANNMFPSNTAGLPSPVNVHSNAVSGPGNTMLRPRDALHMLRPGQSIEKHRQIMFQEIQMQVPQGNAQAVTHFNGMSAPFSNATVSPPVQTFPVQQHQSHQIPQMLGNSQPSHIQSSNHSSTPQQAYIQFAKERQLQQRGMPQAQHSYSGSTTTSHLQNNSQLQQQSQSSSVSSLPSLQPQHKQQPMLRNPQSNGTMSSQMVKQRHRQQVEQQQLQQQPRNSQQVQQQAKHSKSLGRGSMLMHHNLPADGSHVAGLSTAPKSQASEKLIMQQSQGFFSGSAGLNPNLPQPSNQQNLYSRPHTQSSKNVSAMMPSQPDNNQTSVQVPPSHTLVAAQQSIPSSTPLATQQQQLQHCQANPSPANMQRMTLQQNPHLNTDGRIHSTNELVLVKQMVPATSVAHTSDTTSPPTVLPSATHWKQDPVERSMLASTAQLGVSPLENLTGNDSVKIPSGHGLVQSQLPGNILIHDHGAGGQWKQQQQLLHSQPRPPPPSQLQNQQALQGNLYTRPMNSGSG